MFFAFNPPVATGRENNFACIRKIFYRGFLTTLRFRDNAYKTFSYLNLDIAQLKKWSVLRIDPDSGSHLIEIKTGTQITTQPTIPAVSTISFYLTTE